jgi:hypothetical protein
MLRKLHYRATAWLILASAMAAAQLTTDPAWKTKLPSQWSEDDARQVLTKSPWVMDVGGGISRRLTEDMLRDGGVMGQPEGVGYDGVDPKGSGPKVSPNLLTGPGGNDRSPRSLPRGVRLTLCWESALPVRLAGLVAHRTEPPTLETDGYQISVYGVPGSNFKGDPRQLGIPLKNEAALKREGKKDVKPVSVEVFQRQDGLVVVYVFPLSAEITEKDGSVQFEAHIGRVSVSHTFALKDMEFRGKLEL